MPEALCNIQSILENDTIVMKALKCIHTWTTAFLLALKNNNKTPKNIDTVIKSINQPFNTFQNRNQS